MNGISASDYNKTNVDLLVRTFNMLSFKQCIKGMAKQTVKKTVCFALREHRHVEQKSSCILGKNMLF